jgi:hypothetical protein
MLMKVEGGQEVELTYLPGNKTAELAVDNGNEWINVADLSAAELHQLAYHAIQLANEIRSVPGRG